MHQDLASESRSLLRKHGIRPRKRLGQNFAIDPLLIGEILEIAHVTSGDRVLEIGAGLGALTKALAAHALSVQAVELDPALVRVLKEEMGNLPNVKFMHGDIMEMALPRVTTIVSNVPYSISSSLLLKILESQAWEHAILTFQKDFAERLVAVAGSKEYGRLTVAATYYSIVKLHGSYPPDSFLPAPEVYSQIVELKRRTQPPFAIDSPEIFWRLSRVLFTQRNRLLSKALKTLAKWESLPKVWSQTLLDGAPERLLSRRVRELCPEDLAALSDLVSSRAGIGLG